MKVKIENAYSDGWESEKIVEIPDPPAGTTPDQLDEEVWNVEDGTPVMLTPEEKASNQLSYESFWQEFVYQHTGDGHGEDSSLGFCYEATVVEAADPALVGASSEWAG